MSGFSNPIVGGIGALIRQFIKSPNYVAGSEGWSINKDGSAEFNTITARGAITGDSLQTASDDIAPRLTIDNDGLISWFADASNPTIRSAYIAFLKDTEGRTGINILAAEPTDIGGFDAGIKLWNAPPGTVNDSEIELSAGHVTLPAPDAWDIAAPNWVSGWHGTFLYIVNGGRADFQVNLDTNPAFTFGADGNLTDTTIATNLPAALVIGKQYYLSGHWGSLGNVTFAVTANGNLQVTNGTPNLAVPANANLLIYNGLMLPNG